MNFKESKGYMRGLRRIWCQKYLNYSFFRQLQFHAGMQCNLITLRLHLHLPHSPTTIQLSSNLHFTSRSLCFNIGLALWLTWFSHMCRAIHWVTHQWLQHGRNVSCFSTRHQLSITPEYNWSPMGLFSPWLKGPVLWKVWEDCFSYYES